MVKHSAKLFKYSVEILDFWKAKPFVWVKTQSYFPKQPLLFFGNTFFFHSHFFCLYTNCSIIAAWKMVMQMRKGLIQKVVHKVKKMLVNKDKNTASDFLISIKHLSTAKTRVLVLQILHNFYLFLCQLLMILKVFCRCSKY